MKQFHLLGKGAGATDGGRSGGEGRMMREVVDTVVKRTETFGGNGFQDWKFRREIAIKGIRGTESEAFDVVKHGAAGTAARHGGNSVDEFPEGPKVTRPHFLRKCVNPTRVKKLNEVTGVVEKWKMSSRRLEADLREELSSGLKAGILVKMMPSDVADHLSQKITDGDQEEKVGEMISMCVETKADCEWRWTTSSSGIRISTATSATTREA